MRTTRPARTTPPRARTAPPFAASLALAALAVGCGADDTTAPGGTLSGACLVEQQHPVPGAPALRFCMEFSLPADAASPPAAVCAAQRGTPLPACPADGRAGRCVFAASPQRQVLHYYEPIDRDALRMLCERVGGSFSPG
ncbi:MAG: hypothetical protein U0324_15620 [Polyangiales bacterium]